MHGAGVTGGGGGAIAALRYDPVACGHGMLKSAPKEAVLLLQSLDLSPPVSDEVKTTTCYMCACRCGIKVHLTDGKIRYIEGNRDHPVNRGVLCAKGAAGIMQHYAPARLTKPLKRIGERGAGDFAEIEWDEALGLATEWLRRIRESDPRKLAFFTGRDQSQALTGWWATQFGTPNYAAHGGFCSVNMAAGGFYTIGGSFWEFGEPDWERTRYFMLFGCAEDHASNPLKIALGELKARGIKFVSVNPVRTGYSAIADEWLGIRPGTDGLFVLALVHELLRAGKIDVDYLIRYTNAPWLVIQDPGADEDGLFARDEAGRPLVWDRMQKAPRRGVRSRCPPGAEGRGDARRRTTRQAGVPSARRTLSRRGLQPGGRRAQDRHPGGDHPADRRRAGACGVRAGDRAGRALDRRLGAAAPQTIGRPVSMHAMRGISAHANGFHTCRALHLLQILLGTIDVPGGFRYKPPYPKPIPAGPKPAGKAGEVVPGRPLPGPPLGFPTGPEDLLVETDGTPRRIDKAFSWEAPLAAHGMLHLVITNAHNGDPYPIDTLFMYMTNMAWNSAMNTAGTIAMLTAKDPASGDYRIPRIIYSDAYFSEMVAYADLILPDTTYLERWDCISLLDRPISSPDGPAELDPAAGAATRSRRAAVPGRAARSGRAARLAGHGQSGRLGEIPGWLRRLSGASRTPARDRTAGRLARRGRQQNGLRRAQPGPAAALHRARLLLAGRAGARSALLQARQSRVSRVRARDGLHRARPSRSPCSCTARSCRSSAWPRRATARCSRRSSIASVCAPTSIRCRSGIRVRAGRRRGGFPVARHHPAAGGHVSLLGLDEPVAAPDPQLQPAVPASDASRTARARGRRLGSG